MIRRALIVTRTEGEGTNDDPARVVEYVYEEDTLRLIGKIDKWLESLAQKEKES